MSMELMVLSDNRLPSIAIWQQAISTEGLRVTLLTEFSIDRLDGFVPVRSNDIMTGFECYHCDAREIFEQYPGVGFGRSWSDGFIFRWGGDLEECLAAYAAAAAYAKASDGILFDPQGGTLMSWQDALAAIPRIRQESEKWSALPKALAERIGGDS
jgi:hypothetical protein